MNPEVIVSIVIGGVSILSAIGKGVYEYVKKKNFNRIKKNDIDEIIRIIQNLLIDEDNHLESFIKEVRTINLLIETEILLKKIPDKLKTKIDFLRHFVNHNLNLEIIREKYDNSVFYIELMSNLENLVDILEEIKNNL